MLRIEARISENNDWTPVFISDSSICQENEAYIIQQIGTELKKFAFPHSKIGSRLSPSDFAREVIKNDALAVARKIVWESGNNNSFQTDGWIADTLVSIRAFLERR